MNAAFLDTRRCPSWPVSASSRSSRHPLDAPHGSRPYSRPHREERAV